MHYRFLLAACLLGIPAIAQNTPADKPAAPAQQRAVHKGRPQPMERHTRTTWHYHSGPKGNTVPADSSAAKPASPQNATDAGK